jgi:beta-aspartyl-peptidase (threonine type)
MPKSRISLILLALLAGVGLAGVTSPVSLSAAGEPNEPDQAAIQKLMEAQQAAWNHGDIDAFMTAYWRSPDVTFSGTSGIVRGWDAVLARYKSSYADREAMGQLQFSGLEYRVLGPDAALLLGHWHLTRSKGDVGGVFSLVWQRFPEGWRIIHDHTSAVPATN